MHVEAQAVGHDMWAVATSDLDLAAHEVEFPAILLPAFDDLPVLEGRRLELTADRETRGALSGLDC
ncbi:MAG: hypothetical protein ACWGNS_04725, partial [Burkholderiales bacterium]